MVELLWDNLVFLVVVGHWLLLNLDDAPLGLGLAAAGLASILAGGRDQCVF